MQSEPPMPPLSSDMMPPIQHDGGGFAGMPPAQQQEPFEPNPIVSALSQPPEEALPPAPPQQRPRAPAPPRAAPKPRTRPVPDFSGLPPAMAESLAKLAGVPWPPQPEPANEGRQLEDEVAGAAPANKGREG